jgi:hypothetical protein
MPKFTEAVRTADRIVIGDVFQAVPAPGHNGYALQFKLRVAHVLRGEAPAVMAFSKLPSQPCSSPILVREGDRLAIAFEADVFDNGPSVNAAAFLRGTPLHRDIEQLAESEVFALLGLQPPGGAGSGAASWAGVLILGGLLGASAILFMRRPARPAAGRGGPRAGLPTRG